MDGIRKLELRQLDAHVAVAAYGWGWVKIGDRKRVVDPEVLANLDQWQPLTGRETMQWMSNPDVPHFSTDKAVNELLVKKYNLTVLCERKPKMKLKKGSNDCMSMQPVETPVDEHVLCWLIRGGRIDETWWDEELVGVCVHVLRMTTARSGR